MTFRSNDHFGQIVFGQMTITVKWFSIKRFSVKWPKPSYIPPT
jgi:hypothetical protein